MIFGRQKISVYMPPDLRVGDEANFKIVIDAKREINADAVIAELSLVESADEYQQTLFKGGTQIVGKTVLHEGKQEFTCSFVLPKNAPPAFRSTVINYRYQLQVRIDIPWWPDPVESFDIRVLPRAPDQVSSWPLIHAHGPKNSFVARPQVAANGTLVLEVEQEQGFRSDSPVVPIKLVVFSRVTNRNGSPTTASSFAAERTIDLSPKGRGHVAFRLPKSFGPSWDSGGRSFGWFAEVSFPNRTGTSESVRIEATGGEATEPVAPPVTVSDGILQEYWAQVAKANGWSVNEGGFIEHTHAGAALKVDREIRGGRNCLVGTMIYAPLGIDVQAGGKGTFQRFVSTLGGDHGFWAEHELTARDKAQAEHMFADLGNALGHRSLDYLSDELMIVTEPAPRLNDAQAAQLAARLEMLAAQISERRKTMPVPEAFQDYEKVWLEFAHAENGSFDPGPCALDITFQGQRVRIETQWEMGLPVGFRLTMFLRSKVRPEWWGPVLRQGGESSRPEKLDGALVELSEPDRFVEVSEDALYVSVPVVPEDPALANPVLSQMRSVIALLQESVPYR